MRLWLHCKGWVLFFSYQWTKNPPLVILIGTLWKNFGRKKKFTTLSNVIKAILIPLYIRTKINHSRNQVMDKWIKRVKRHIWTSFIIKTSLPKTRKKRFSTTWKPWYMLINKGLWNDNRAAIVCRYILLICDVLRLHSGFFRCVSAINNHHYHANHNRNSISVNSNENKMAEGEEGEVKLSHWRIFIVIHWGSIAHALSEQLRYRRVYDEWQFGTLNNYSAWWTAHGFCTWQSNLCLQVCHPLWTVLWLETWPSFQALYCQVWNLSLF